MNENLAPQTLLEMNVTPMSRLLPWYKSVNKNNVYNHMTETTRPKFNNRIKKLGIS